MKLHIDIETYSEIDLRVVGSYRYAEDPTTGIHTICYAIDDEPAQIWDGNVEELQSLINKADTIHAWNATFERLLLKNVLKIEIPLSKIMCTMSKAMYCSLPAALDACGLALKLDILKDKSAKPLMIKCSKNPKITKLDLEKLNNYCLKDVEAERAIERKLPEMNDKQLSLFQRDYINSEKCNDRGLPVNVEFVKKAAELYENLKNEALDKLQTITGLDNPNSPSQLKGWLSEKLGTEINSLDKAAVEKLLSTQKDPKIIEVLELKQASSSTSCAKFSKILESMSSGNRLRGCFQVFGASRTGRDAGRIFQPQNLPRGTLSDDEIEYYLNNVNEIKDLKTLSSLIRASISYNDQNYLAIADYSSIEPRVAGHISNCSLIKNSLKDNKDLYKVFASIIFRVRYDDVTKDQRTAAKPMVLGCCYGLGSKGLQLQMENYGVHEQEEKCLEYVKTYRETHHEIVSLWRQLEASFINSTSNKRIEHKNDYTTIELPSGRKLYYWHVRTEKSLDMYKKIRSNPTYLGINSVNKQWCRIKTYGAKLFENIVQAISRDIMFDAVDACEKKGIKVIGRVHDELIAENVNHNILKDIMENTTDSKFYPKIPVESFNSDNYKK